MVCGVEFDADAEGWRDYFAGLGEDFKDEAGAFGWCAAIFVCAEVCLGLLVCSGA